MYNPYDPVNMDKLLEQHTEGITGVNDKPRLQPHRCDMCREEKETPHSINSSWDEEGEVCNGCYERISKAADELLAKKRAARFNG